MGRAWKERVESLGWGWTGASNDVVVFETLFAREGYLLGIALASRRCLSASGLVAFRGQVGAGLQVFR